MISIPTERSLCWPWQLRRRSVLGINARNIGFLLELNPRGFYPALDDKVLTKRICQAHQVPVPETFVVIARAGDLRGLSGLIGDREEFVVKPAKGAGGRGVVVVVGHNGAGFETVNGQTLSSAQLRHHITTILSGSFSLGDRPDRAIVEQRIVTHRVFQRLAVGGTPDVRVIVYRDVPVMAMLRLPTRASRGRANLHQGAIGVGIDLQTGRTFGGVYHDRAITVHPEMKISIEGIEIPYWQDSLAIAARLSAALRVGYLGVDMVLDANRGPLVLEANARPGLAIQIANRCGLLSRLERVEERQPETLGQAYRRTVATPLPNSG